MRTQTQRLGGSQQVKRNTAILLAEQLTAYYENLKMRQELNPNNNGFSTWFLAENQLTQNRPTQNIYLQ